MNTFLRERVNNEPLDSHPPARLKPAPLTFPPKPRARPDLPYGPADAHCYHAEEHDPHPRRDIAEDFASGVIHGLQTVQKACHLGVNRTFSDNFTQSTAEKSSKFFFAQHEKIEEPFKPSPSLGGARR
jgi:hypothetical protein